MKSGSKIGQVKEELKKYDGQIQMVTNCGMKEEQIYYSLDEIPEQVGYYSLIIAKEGENDDLVCWGRTGSRRSDYCPGGRDY